MFEATRRRFAGGTGNDPTLRFSAALACDGIGPIAEGCISVCGGTCSSIGNLARLLGEAAAIVLIVWSPGLVGGEGSFADNALSIIPSELRDFRASREIIYNFSAGTGRRESMHAPPSPTLSFAPVDEFVEESEM